MMPPRALASPLLASLALLLAPSLAPAQAAKPKPPIDWDRLVDPSLPATPVPPRVNLIPGKSASATAPSDEPVVPPDAVRGDGLAPRDPAVGPAAMDRAGNRPEVYFRTLNEGTTEFARHVEAAKVAIERRDWVGAIAAACEARVIEPDALEVDALWIALDEAMGRKRHLIATYDAAIRRHPTEAVLWLGRGVARCQEFDRGGWEDIEQGARLAGGPIPPRGPEPVAAYRAAALAALGDHAAAVPAFDEAIAQSPAPANLRLGLVQSLVNSGQVDRALAELETPVPLEYAHEMAMWRSYVLTRTGRFVEALAVSDTLPRTTNDGKAELVRVFCLVAVGRTAEAHALADSLRDRWPSNSLIRTFQAGVALAERDWGRAYDLFGELAGGPDGRMAIGCYYRPEDLMHPDFDWATTHFDERCRAVPSLAWALVTRFGDDARSSRMPRPAFAVAWVARTRPDAGLAPSFCLYAIAYHELQPWRPYAHVGQVAAALALGDRAKLLAAFGNVRAHLFGPYAFRDRVRAQIREAWGL